MITKTATMVVMAALGAALAVGCDRDAPATDPKHASCEEANEAGHGPYVRGEDPEYGWYRDSDGDGRVCEPSR